MKLPARCCAFTIVTCLSCAVFADTLTIGASRDNTLYQDSTGSTSNGAGQYFFAGRTAAGEIRRGLIWFNFAVIPAGSTIESVSLTLHMSRTTSGTTSVGLHRVAIDWGEGASDAPSQEGGGITAAPGDATWLHTFYPTSFWTNPGGDFAATASGSTSVGAFGNYSWTSPGLVADVQAWVNAPASNHGWLLNNQGGAKRFDTRESTDPNVRPSLTVMFTPVPEPANVALVAIASLALLRRR